MDATAQIPEIERQDPNILSPEEASELLAGHPWSRFVVMGDSLAKGLGDPSEGYAAISWGERVAAALASVRPDLDYVNLAERQLKAADVRDSQLARALDLQPDLVAVIAGGNDLLVEEFDVAPVKAVLEEIVAALQDGGATVMTWEVVDLPGALGAGFELLGAHLRLLHEAIREIAQERGTVHVDLYSQPWSRERYCVSEDLQHASMRGQALGATVAIKALGEHLRKTGG